MPTHLLDLLMKIKLKYHLENSLKNPVSYRLINRVYTECLRIYIVMVIKSTNIYNVYQKNNNQLSPLILTEYKKATTYDVGNPGPGLAQKCGEVKPVNEILTPLNNWISNG